MSSSSLYHFSMLSDFEHKSTLWKRALKRDYFVSDFYFLCSSFYRSSIMTPFAYLNTFKLSLFLLNYSSKLGNKCETLNLHIEKWNCCRRSRKFLAEIVKSEKNYDKFMVIFFLSSHSLDRRKRFIIQTKSNRRLILIYEKVMVILRFRLSSERAPSIAK